MIQKSIQGVEGGSIIPPDRKKRSPDHFPATVLLCLIHFLILLQHQFLLCQSFSMFATLSAIFLVFVQKLLFLPVLATPFVSIFALWLPISWFEGFHSLFRFPSYLVLCSFWYSGIRFFTRYSRLQSKIVHCYTLVYCLFWYSVHWGFL